MKKRISTMVLALMMLIGCASISKAQFSISVNIAPPALITYDQPECPGDGYLWIPGYWAYSPESEEYYWVPGYWTLPPSPGLLWTPGYWGFNGSSYVWSAGYWGRNVGFYGGINYGFGYFGSGYVGGMWRGNNFIYNTAVNHINTSIIRNTYNRDYARGSSRVSFNGRGGMQTRSTTTERQYGQQQRYQPTSDQRMHRISAVSNTQLHYDNNGGNVRQEHIDNQRQNYQNFKQQHQNEPEFKSSGAVPMNNGRGQSSNNSRSQNNNRNNNSRNDGGRQ